MHRVTSDRMVSLLSLIISTRFALVCDATCFFDATLSNQRLNAHVLSVKDARMCALCANGRTVDDDFKGYFSRALNAGAFDVPVGFLLIRRVGDDVVGILQA